MNNSTHLPKRQAIILASGSGARMGSDLPKQFLPLAGKPLLMHTLERFKQFDASIDLFLVLSETTLLYWEECCAAHHFTLPHQIVIGGSERFYSVRNAVQVLSSDTLVAIHDGVRPFVSDATLARCFQAAEQYGAAIPFMPLIESIRQVQDEVSTAVNRAEFVSVQTPQVFRSDWLKQAFEQAFTETFTDDASVMEAAGHAIYLVEGNRENIKITTPFDMHIAEALYGNFDKND